MARKLGIYALTLFCLLWSGTAFAVPRTMYFNAVGRNSVKFGIVGAERSRCLISVTNGSSIEQLFRIDVSDSYSTMDGGATKQPLTTDPSFGTLISLPAGDSRTYEAVFTPVPANTANQNQDVTCKGSITADNVKNPGFISANGSLITFHETTAQVGGDSGQSKGRQAVFNQISIQINESKPF